MNIIMLHLKDDGTWENIPVTVADGEITGIFTSLSPVYYFEVENAEEGTDTGSGTNPGNATNQGEGTDTGAGTYEPSEVTFTGEDGREMRWLTSENNGNISISGSQTSIPAGARFSAGKVYQGKAYEEIAGAVAAAKGNVVFEAYDFH